MENETQRKTSGNAVLERRFLAKVIYRLGGKKLTESFVEAKSLGVEAEMFSDPTCRVLWMATEELFSEPDFEQASISTVVMRAKGIVRKTKDAALKAATPGKEFLDAAEATVRGDDDIRGYHKLFLAAYAIRKAREEFQKADDAFDAGEDPLEVISRIQGKFDGIVGGASGKDSEVSIKALTDDILALYCDVYHHRQELGEKDYRGEMIPLPWPSVDRAIGGIGTVMTIVAARTAVGKTSFACALIRYWLSRGMKVVFNSLDMEAREAVMRQMSEGSGVSARKLKNGDVDPKYWEQTYGSVKAAADELVKYEEDGLYRLEEQFDVNRLRAQVKILKNQGRIDILVVDYLQLLTFSGAERLNDTMRVAKVSYALRMIANQIKVPVVALAQINRTAAQEGEEPELHHIKDSGQIEQDAANIIILHPAQSVKRSWETNPPVQFSPNGRPEFTRSIMPMWVKVAKARDGEPNLRIPFVVIQGRYSWFEGNAMGEGDEKFSAFYPNAWKPDPLEPAWRQTGALLDPAVRDGIEELNRRNGV